MLQAAIHAPNFEPQRRDLLTFTVKVSELVDPASRELSLGPDKVPRSPICPQRKCHDKAQWKIPGAGP